MTRIRPPARLASSALVLLLFTTGANAQSRSDDVSELAARTGALGELIVENSQSLSATLAPIPTSFDSAPVRDAARAVQSLASELDRLATRVSSRDAATVRAFAAEVRANVGALASPAAGITDAERSIERLGGELARAERIGTELVATAARIEWTLASLREPSASDLDLIARLGDALLPLNAAAEAHARALPGQLAPLGSAVTALSRVAPDLQAYTSFAAAARALTSTVARFQGTSQELAPLLGDVSQLVAAIARDRFAITLAGAVDTVVDIAEVVTGGNYDILIYEGGVRSIIDLLLPLPAPDPTVTSFRIMTWNIAFLAAEIELPFPADAYTYEPNDGVFSGLDYETRAHRVADAILRGDQDVIVLNEVFSETAREILVERLGGTYKSYIAKLAGTPNDGAEFTFDELLQGSAPGPASALIEALFALWPDQTDYLVRPADSGLMIFSRYPFLPLEPNAPNEAWCDESSCDLEGRNDANPFGLLMHDEVAFRIYDNCADMDCMASKGVGVVNIDAPTGPKLVAFTHLQADEPDDLEFYAMLRNIQLYDVKETLAASVPAGSLGSSAVYYLGDINIPGHNRVLTEDPSEWSDVLDPATALGEGLLACGNAALCEFDGVSGHLLTDAWGFETSPLDPGLTQLNDHERFDYVLHNNPDGRQCMQHVHIAYDLADEGSVWYSDHLPVRADFSATGLACSANDAAGNGAQRVEDLVFAASDCDHDDTTAAPECDSNLFYAPPVAKLLNAGQFQWYRINEAGSYSIRISAAADARVAYEVYQGEDLSRPIAPFSDVVHPRWGTPYSMLKPPYYIRVFAVDGAGVPDRAASNRSYGIAFHQHLCRSPEDACFLTPPFKHPYLWPQVTSFTRVHELFFQLQTSGVKGGRFSPEPIAYPEVKVQQEAPSWFLDCLQPPELHMYSTALPVTHQGQIDFDGVEIDGDGDWDDVDGQDERWLAPDLDGEVAGLRKIYHVKMRRFDQVECEAPMTTFLRFETDLTYFTPGRMRCINQYDDSGVAEDDWNKFRFFFDVEAPFDYNWCDSNPCHHAQFDEPDGDGWLSDVDHLSGWYVDAVNLRLWEDEDGADFLYPIPYAIDTLYPLFERVSTSIAIEENPNPDTSDWTYRMDYLKCREQNGCWH